VTRFYLSSNTTLDASDPLLGSRAVPALAAGASSAASTSVTIPAGTVTGTYYIVAQADALATNAETNETNNNGFSSIRIGPDLTISGLTGATAVGAGGPITVTETTKNAGGGSAGASTTRYYFSTNSTVDASDVPLGSRSVPVLAAGASSANTVTFTIPANAATGTYYLIAQADADGAVAETLETNNIGYLTLRVGPDLVVTNLTVPTSAGAGTAFSVTDTTKNQGGGSAGASTTRFYLSTNSTFDASDILLGGRGVGVLAANATGSGSTGLVMPAGTAAGTRYIIAVADGDGGVAETSETNNTRATSITVK
jgi:subtilase family serine protease